MAYYEIEKGVQLPTPKRKGTYPENPRKPRPREFKYPIRDMAVGDSFLVPSKGEALAAVASCRAMRQRGTNNYHLTMRVMDDGTARVWRVK